MSTSLDEVPTSQEAKPFVNENLMRAENRINVALFGAHAIPGFWKRLRTLLGLPENAYLDRVVANGTPIVRIS